MILLASSNGRIGMAAAMDVLRAGGSALDAVEAGIRLVEANPEELAEKSRFTPAEAEGKKTYSVPVVANGKLYVRLLDQLIAYDIKKS